MMTLLQLTQRFAQEASSGLAGSITTTAAATGELLRLTNWIQTAWNEVQTKHDDWEWMRSSVLLGGGQGMSFTTVAGTYTYPFGVGAGKNGILLANFGKWKKDTFRCNTTATGFQDELDLDYLSYDAYRESYLFGAMRAVQTRPVVVAIGPDKSICLGPPPNGNYTITGDYYIAPTSMVNDADVPTGLPDRFNLVIVYQAMLYYAAYEAAPEVEARGQQKYDELMSEMEVNYTPEITFAGALA